MSSNTKVLGRPQAKEPRKARQVRWTDREWDRVQAAATAAGLTSSEFIRRATLARAEGEGH